MFTSHFLKAQRFVDAALTLFTQGDLKPLSACRNETLLYVMHMQMFMSYLIRNRQMRAFLGRLKEFCSQNEAPDGLYDTCVGILISTTAMGSTLLSSTTAVAKKVSIQEAIAAIIGTTDEDLSARLMVYSMTVSTALTDFYSYGVVPEKSASVFSGYLYGCFVMVLVATTGKAPLIPAINSEYVMGSGVKSEKQARCIADFVSTTNSLLLE